VGFICFLKNTAKVTFFTVLKKLQEYDFRKLLGPQTEKSIIRRAKILTAVKMATLVCVGTLYGLVGTDQRFEGTYCLQS
jgi:hypothetical protein